MKKAIILTAMLIASLNILAQSRTLSNTEIVECKTPESVAWNFVMSIVNEDYSKMEKLTSPHFLSELYSWSWDSGLSFSEMFTEENLHDISGMRPLLTAQPQKYFLSITWTQTTTLEYTYSSGKSYSNLKGYSVSFNCVDSYGNYYSGNDHDTSARVVLVYLDNAWRVAYFK